MSKQKGLSEMDREKLETQLNEESKDLQTQFSSLVVQIQGYVVTNSTCDDLRTCLMCMSNVNVAFQENSPLNTLKSAKTIADIIFILLQKKLLSFLHYSLIKTIVKSFCEKSTEIKDKLEKYNKAFDEYIKRRVCETSLYYDGQFKVFTGSDSEETVKLLILTDENWNEYTEFVRVKNLKPIIARAFRCNEFFLALQSIEPQCLKLRYALIPSLVDHIFPLTLEEWNKLRSHGVAEIHCKDYHYMVDEKCKLHMIHVLCDVALTVMHFHIAAVTEKGFVNVFIDQQYSSKGM